MVRLGHAEGGAGSIASSSLTRGDQNKARSINLISGGASAFCPQTPKLEAIAFDGALENLAQADALLFGRVTYEMMEAAWRPSARTGVRPDWMADWMEPFARTIDAAKKYVVSSPGIEPLGHDPCTRRA